MSFWILLWKSVFVLGVSAFAVMSVWVTIWGGKDLVYLLRTIRAQHERE